MVIPGKDVCCSVVFGSLVGVFVFSVMWYELLMTSVIGCPLWSSVYECHKSECAFISLVRTECGMFVMYVSVCCFVVRGCAVSRMYIAVCYCDMFSVVAVMYVLLFVLHVCIL